MIAPGRRLFAACALAAIAASQTANHYPAHWWTPVPESSKRSWEILPQSAKPGEVVLSKRNELGILSNFAATPFTLRGKRYASVEGFWQMMLYPENASDPRATNPNVTWRYTRAQVSQMASFEAKEAGTLGEDSMRKLGIDWVTFEGKRLPYRSMTKGEHYRIIREAMSAKLDQNPRVREVLLSTGELTLRPDHIQEKDAPPEWASFQIWMEIRSELQKQSSRAALDAIEYSDQPKFVVAGITQSPYVGGYGSDAGVRSIEALSKATVSLKNDSAKNASETILRASLESDPKNSALHHSLANAEEQSGKPLDAVHEYQRAAELDPSETNLFDWATELLLHDAPQAASEVFKNGTALYPRSSRMLLGAAVTAYTQSEYASAATLFFKATDVQPSAPDPYLFLANVQAPEITQTGDYLQRMTRFVQLCPDNAQANLFYATALRNSRNKSNDPAMEARVQAALEKAVQLDPNLAPAYFQLGNLYTENQNFRQRSERVRKAITADPPWNRHITAWQLLTASWARCKKLSSNRRFSSGSRRRLRNART